MAHLLVATQKAVEGVHSGEGAAPANTPAAVDDERTQSLLLVQAAHLRRPPMNVHIPVYIIQPSARVFLGEVILTNCSCFYGK